MSKIKLQNRRIFSRPSGLFLGARTRKSQTNRAVNRAVKPRLQCQLSWAEYALVLDEAIRNAKRFPKVPGLRDLWQSVRDSFR